MARPTEPRRLHRLLWAGAAGPSLHASVTAVHAEVHLAMRTSHQCSACHVNQTGGGKRNAFGVSYGLEQLPDFKLSPEDAAKAFQGRIVDAFWIGADLRAAN